MIAGGSSNKLDNNSENSMIGSGVSNLIDNQSDKSFIAAGEQNTIDRNSTSADGNSVDAGELTEIRGLGTGLES